MGSRSGSAVSDVPTTGAASIPAMRRTGFSAKTAKTAAAIEACASTGGAPMPPMMGATAFVMASFLSRPSVEIALAVAIPSILFYWALFAQIDAYAARRAVGAHERAARGPALRPRLRTPAVHDGRRALVASPRIEPFVLGAPPMPIARKAGDRTTLDPTPRGRPRGERNRRGFTRTGELA